MSATVLHVLSQRPLFTGSGIIIDVFTRLAERKGWNQHAVVGMPTAASVPSLGGLEPSRVHPLFFGQGSLNFPVPGMSDVMPYESTRFSEMTAVQIRAYKNAWSEHLAAVISKVRPDLIHAHHIWLVSSLLKDIAPNIPVVNQCHATGLRQMVLCPHLKDEVVNGCRRNERFVAAYQGQADRLSRVLDVSPKRVSVIGSGYDEELFHPVGRSRGGERSLLYAGKLSRAKGLPWLLDAVEKLGEKGVEIELHIAGSGAGKEAAEITARMNSMKQKVAYHGQLTQRNLAVLMRKRAVFALPSFYEGVPLVLVEALACGMRLISTNLPGVLSELKPHLGEALEMVPMPRITGADEPEPADLDEFTGNLAAAIERAVYKPPIDHCGDFCKNALAQFKWSAVFDRVESVWKEAR